MPVFYSYEPYLQIAPIRGYFIEFSKECTYTPKNEEELQLLREYAKRTSKSFIISEVMLPEELKRKSDELWDKEVQEAEERIRAKEEKEKADRELHEFYSLLRM